MKTVLWTAIALCLTTGTEIFAAQASDARLINGQPVGHGSYDEVVRINTGGSGCSATVVGPRVIVTAAHCGKTGATSVFKVHGKEYRAKLTRSPLYPGKDHDIAVGVTAEEITGIKPASVGGVAQKGTDITLLGYGCTKPGGGGGNDGILRMGKSRVTGFSAFDMVSRMAGGAALCYGDSGGPAFVLEGGKHLLLGVNSKGNIKDTNYNTRTDTAESKKFLEDFAAKQDVDICGVNTNCAPNES